MTLYGYTINLNDAVLLATAVGLMLLLTLWQRDANSTFDLKDAIVDGGTGRVSLQKIGQLVALLISSWAFVYETRAGRLTEWFFMAYMVAWAGANLGSKWLDQRKASTEGTP